MPVAEDQTIIRRPDGSIDIAHYTERARLERAVQARRLAGPGVIKRLFGFRFSYDRSVVPAE